VQAPKVAAIFDPSIADVLLKTRLRSQAALDPDFWSFKKDAIRENTHAFFQYPAMMVPQMLARLLSDVQAVRPEIRSVFDPFAGSGTVLTEAMLRGLDFYGRDINPLAVLLCRVKAGPFDVEKLRDRAARLRDRITMDSGQSIEVRFKGWHKWFRKDVAIRLSRIVRGIRKENCLWSRRFFWIALAETTRLVSNSRTSTFKLHIRPTHESNHRALRPERTFGEILESNINQLEAKRGLLQGMNKLASSHYTGVAKVDLGDSSTIWNANNRPQYDLLITSPPYGDNTSTVPYGQHSYLPLQWIDLADVEPKVNRDLVSNTHAIDSRSLGGSRKDAIKGSLDVQRRSPSLAKVLKELGSIRPEAQGRVAAFFRDLNRSIDPILSHLKPNAYMFWVVGNRRVAERLIPLQDILTELLCDRKAVCVTTFERRIHSKRMAVRNDTAQTMRKETILVLRKAI